MRVAAIAALSFMGACAAAAGTFTDDEIAVLVHRIEVLAEKESTWPRIDTLARTSALFANVDPGGAARLRARGETLRKGQTGRPPRPLAEVRPVLEDTVALGDREAIENAAEQVLDAIEHSGECPDDYAWFAAARRHYDLVKGGDNASVRAREALFDLEDLVRTDFRFDLRDVNGAAVVLQPAPERLTIVSFWATWCGPCVQEVPMLSRVASAAANSVRLAGVTDEPAESVRAFIGQNAPDFPALLDPDRLVFHRYRIETLPALLIVDVAGRVRFRSGAITEPELRAALRRLSSSR